MKINTALANAAAATQDYEDQEDRPRPSLPTFLDFVGPKSPEATQIYEDLRASQGEYQDAPLGGFGAGLSGFGGDPSSLGSSAFGQPQATTPAPAPASSSPSSYAKIAALQPNETVKNWETSLGQLQPIGTPQDFHQGANNGFVRGAEKTTVVGNEKVQFVRNTGGGRTSATKIQNFAEEEEGGFSGDGIRRFIDLPVETMGSYAKNKYCYIQVLPQSVRKQIRAEIYTKIYKEKRQYFTLMIESFRLSREDEHKYMQHKFITHVLSLPFLEKTLFRWFRKTAFGDVQLSHPPILAVRKRF